MKSFNKTEAAVFSCRLCFLRAFPFISLKLSLIQHFVKNPFLHLSTEILNILSKLMTQNHESMKMHDQNDSHCHTRRNLYIL